MTSVPPTRLGTVACRVLEEAAFLFAATTARRPDWPAAVVEVALTYAGPTAGTLRLRATPELGAEVAANLMGLDPWEPEAADHAAGALAELLNIVAGALLADVHGTGAVFQLGIPEVRIGPPNGPLGDAVVVLRADDQHLLEFADDPAPRRPAAGGVR